jgi:hypothetical protein
MQRYNFFLEILHFLKIYFSDNQGIIDKQKKNHDKHNQKIK